MGGEIKIVDKDIQGERGSCFRFSVSIVVLGCILRQCTRDQMHPMLFSSLQVKSAGELLKD